MASTASWESKRSKFSSSVLIILSDTLWSWLIFFRVVTDLCQLLGYDMRKSRRPEINLYFSAMSLSILVNEKHVQCVWSTKTWLVSDDCFQRPAFSIGPGRPAQRLRSLIQTMTESSLILKTTESSLIQTISSESVISEYKGPLESFAAKLYDGSSGPNCLTFLSKPAATV